MKKELKEILFIVILFVAVVMISFGLIIILSLFYPDLHDRALLGESFGFVSVIFTGLSLIAIVVSLYFQREDLKITRKELKKTFEAQDKSQKALTLQVKIMTIQIINENNKMIFPLESEILDLEQKIRSLGSIRSFNLQQKLGLKKMELENIKKNTQEMEASLYE